MERTHPHTLCSLKLLRQVLHDWSVLVFYFSFKHVTIYQCICFWLSRGGLGTPLSTTPLPPKKQVLKPGWDTTFPTIMSVLLRWKAMFVLYLLHMPDLQSPGYSTVELYNHEEQFHISTGCYCLIPTTAYSIYYKPDWFHSVVSCSALPHSYWHYWHFLFL